MTQQTDHEEKLLPTKVLLQAGRDVVIFGCGSLSASVSAGQASLGFCLLSFTLYLYSAAVGGGHSNYPCLQQYPIVSSYISVTVCKF